MDIKKAVNVFCLIMGVCVIIFGGVVIMGAIDNIESERGIVPIFLGGIIILWAVISIIRSNR